MALTDAVICLTGSTIRVDEKAVYLAVMACIENEKVVVRQRTGPAVRDELEQEAFSVAIGKPFHGQILAHTTSAGLPLRSGAVSRSS